LSKQKKEVIPLSVNPLTLLVEQNEFEPPSLSDERAYFFNLRLNERYCKMVTARNEVTQQSHEIAASLRIDT